MTAFAGYVPRAVFLFRRFWTDVSFNIDTRVILVSEILDKVQFIMDLPSSRKADLDKVCFFVTSNERQGQAVIAGNQFRDPL